MVTTAASVETRVLVLRLLNIIATVLPLRDSCTFLGTRPFLISFLCCLALLTRVTSSAGERSAMDRKCRGAKGETAGSAGLAGPE